MADAMNPNEQSEQPGYTLKQMRKIVPIEEYVEEYVDVPRFLKYCRECESYGQRWSCPPFKFDPMTLWHCFKRLWLWGLVLVPEPGTNLSDLLNSLEHEKNIMLDELLKLEQEIPGSLALSAGTCKLCPEGCSRSCNIPCRRMAQMRWSVEALGGDVAKTTEQIFHTPMLWIKNGILPDYLMLVGGLLLREANS